MSTARLGTVGLYVEQVELHAVQALEHEGSPTGATHAALAQVYATLALAATTRDAQ